MLSYNCSPSFNWKKKLSDAEIATFQKRLGELGYKFQFVTLAGFHSLNYGMFSLAKDYAQRGEWRSAPVLGGPGLSGWHDGINGHMGLCIAKLHYGEACDHRVRALRNIP